MTEVTLTAEMRDALASALADGAPTMVASASAAGVPDIVFKGSAMVWDADHLAFWERARGTTLQNLKENANVCLLYRNPQTRQSWKFWGVASLYAEGELRQQVMDRTIPLELDRDPERKGIAVLIRVDRVVERGRVIMERALAPGG